MIRRSRGRQAGRGEWEAEAPGERTVERRKKCDHDRQQVQGLRGRLFICEAAGALGAAEGGRAADELAEHGAGEGAVEQRDARGAF